MLVSIMSYGDEITPDPTSLLCRRPAVINLSQRIKADTGGRNNSRAVGR
jgi:hypothetical protein